MKILFVSNYSAYGDQIATNGMINFLSLHYDKICILVNWNFAPVVEQLYFSNDKVMVMSFDYFMFNDIRNEFSGDIDCMCLLSEEYLSLNDTCRLSPWELASDAAITIPDFLEKNISSEVYSQINPIGFKFGFDIVRDKNLDMVSEFYNKMGFPDEMKYKSFYFSRFEKDENNLLERLNLPSQYAVVCEYDKQIDENFQTLDISTKNATFGRENIICRKFITSKYVVNLHMLSKKYFDVVKLIENAQEVHLIENSFAMFIYFLQLSGRMKKVPIIFHAYYRKESHRKNNYKVYMKPKLDNWTFIFDSSSNIEDKNLFHIVL